MKSLFGIVAGIFAGYAVKHIIDKRTFQAQDELISMHEDMMDETPVERSWADPDYRPQCAWKCDHCGALLQFHDSLDGMQKHFDEIKDCDGLICPTCLEYNEIDEFTRMILNDTEKRI